MTSEITFGKDPQKPIKKPTRTTNVYKEVRGNAGTIANTIGEGENAKNSFIWMAIRYSFWIGALTSLAIYARPLYCQVDLQTNLLEDIKGTWQIFLPVITLALGYSFGKGK